MSDNSLQGAPTGADEAAQAAPEREATAASGSEDNGAPAGEEQPSEPRTFTQEELDRIVAERVAKAERKAKREMQQAAQQPKPLTIGEPPNPQDYETALEYADALAEHKAAVIVAQREQRERQAQTNSSFEERVETARDKYEDYDTVVFNDDLTITPAMAQVIKTSEVGPDVAYYLGKNPKEAERIAGLDPLAQARELGKIEVKVTGNPPAKKASSAPEPITPVRRGNGGPSHFDPTDPRSLKMDPGAWIKARNEQVAKKTR